MALDHSDDPGQNTHQPRILRAMAVSSGMKMCAMAARSEAFEDDGIFEFDEEEGGEEEGAAEVAEGGKGTSLHQLLIAAL